LASTNATDPRPEVLGSGSGTRINEWMAAAGATNDFVELFNPDPFPVDLARWVLTDDPSVGGATNRPFGPLSFISGGGFTRYRLDGSPADVPAAKLDFRLDALGETLGLFSPAGLRVDSVDYLRQEDDVSEGRYPDGGPQFRRFPGTATPGAPNRVPATDSDADGMDDAWELANGLDPGDPRDATRDADGDGTNNRDEYLAGTDPRSAASVFRAAGRRAAPGTFDLRFGAVAGRTYSVLAAASPAGPWTRVSDVPAGEAREVAVSLDGTAAGARFYRVVTPAMP
jgi:hypothetical protein